jgi:hypothetical protein
MQTRCFRGRSHLSLLDVSDNLCLVSNHAAPFFDCGALLPACGLVSHAAVMDPKESAASSVEK